MTKIGFTGTRKGMTKIQKEKLLEILGNNFPFEFHHGDCIGADEEAHKGASYFDHAKIVIHPPDNDKQRAFCHLEQEFTVENILDEFELQVEVREEKPYLDRNRDIVDETDFLIAFPNGSDGAGKNRRSGTWYTVRYARSVNKPVTIVYQNGNIDRLT